MRVMPVVIRLGVMLLVMASLAGCGYRSVIAKGSYGIGSHERFAPFLVRNVTADIGVSHVVGSAALQELGRRDRLGTRDGDGLYEVRLTIRRVTQRAVAFAPNGSIIEYLGDLGFDYTVYAPGSTTPLTTVRAESLWYRYYASPNPHILQQHRDTALAEAVRGWVPKMLMQTSVLADRHRARDGEEIERQDGDDEAAATAGHGDLGTERQEQGVEGGIHHE